MMWITLTAVTAAVSAVVAFILSQQTHRSVTLQVLHYFSRPHDRSLKSSHTIAFDHASAAWHPETVQVQSWRSELPETVKSDLLNAVENALKRFNTTSTMKLMKKYDFVVSKETIELMRRWLGHLDPRVGGLGFHVVRGLPVDQLDYFSSQLMFWGIGLWMGLPGAQNKQGDLLGVVEDIFAGNCSSTSASGACTANPRLYLTNDAIDFHCDPADIVGLLTLENSAVGGKSLIASSVSIYNYMLRHHPHLIDVLFLPFLMDTHGDGGKFNYIEVQPVAIDKARNVRTFFHCEYFRTSYEYPGAPQMTPLQAEAVRTYCQIARKLSLEMDLLPGDMQFVSNHYAVHARTKYEEGIPGEQQQDGKKLKRRLLRLWLSYEVHGLFDMDATVAKVTSAYRFAKALITQKYLAL